MVGADDLENRALALQQLVPSVLADVVESPQFSVAAPERGNALALHNGGDVASGFPQLFLMAEELPRLVENLLALDSQPARIGVGRCPQGQGTGRVGVPALRNRKEIFASK